ncbi:hypothetical protein WMP95_11360, partial [Corynebacterium marquesiae]
LTSFGVQRVTTTSRSKWRIHPLTARFTIGSSLNNQHPALSTALAQAINQLHVFEPAPTAFVLDSGEHVELYTRAVVDTSVGLDDQALLNAIQKWGPYVYDFNERIFAQLQG